MGRIAKIIVNRPGPPGADGAGLTSAQAAALTPGTPGQIKATVGGVITNVKPGRIDARVRGVSTAASDNTSQLNALAIEAATNGAELWLPEGIYPGMMEMVSNLRVGGTGTLRVPSSWHPQALYIDAADVISNVVVEGITLDANNQNKILVQFNAGSAGFGSASHHVTFRNVRFRNCGDWAVGGKNATDVTFDHCRFENVKTACYPWNAAGWRILHCTIDTTAENAFFFPVDVNAPLRGFQFVGNVGVNIGRMMLELWKQVGATGRFEAPIIADNQLSSKPSSLLPDAYGYSLVCQNNARIHHNVAICNDATNVPPFGFEFEGIGLEADHNYAYGYRSGALLNVHSHMTVNGFTAEDCWVGVELANQNSALMGITLNDVTAINPRDAGIYVRRQATGTLMGAHVIRRPRVIRDKAWAGDSGRTFSGIKSEGMLLPLAIEQPLVIQGMATPQLERFWGIEAHAEDMNMFIGSTIDGAVFVDRATTPMMRTIVGPGPAAPANVTVTKSWKHTTASTVPVAANGFVSAY